MRKGVFEGELVFIKNSVYKDSKNNSKKVKFKKEKTLDYYIYKIDGDDPSVNWWDEDNVDDVLNKEDHKKLEFLKQNIKASSIIPKDTEKKQTVPNDMGYFETRFGTIEVGYDKYGRNSPIAFSIVPESDLRVNRIPKQKIDSPDTYFGGPIGGENKRFRASNLSYVLDPERDGNIDKMEDDEDGLVDDQEKLLYQYKAEEDKIEDLENRRNGLDVVESRKIDKELEKIRTIKEEKEEDNIEFFKEIKGFIDKLKKRKLKKYVDADDFISMKKRIIEISSESQLGVMSLIELRRLLEEILEVVKRSNNGRLPDDLIKFNFSKFGKKKLREMIVGLKHRFF